MKRALLVVALLVLSMLPGVAQTQPQTDYDSFFKLDVRSRIALFNQITPENRAALVKEQIERWTDANRAQLSPAQLDALKAAAAFATADRYRLPKSEQAKKEAADLEQRVMALFSREQGGQAFTIQADYIPKK